jgi:hypothetical protein
MTAEDYTAKADEMLVQLEAATSEAERSRLKRARGAYLKLARHRAEASEARPARPKEKLVPEKPRATAPTQDRYRGLTDRG